jgi:hypothetical protein
MRTSALGIVCRQRRRVLLQDRSERLGGAVRLEGTPPAQHLVQDRSEREQVGSLIDFAAAHLLGRKIAERAADRRIGVQRQRGSRRRLAGAILRETRETEVENLDPVRAGDEQVLGLQVAVDDAALVGSRQPRT